MNASFPHQKKTFLLRLKKNTLLRSNACSSTASAKKRLELKKKQNAFIRLATIVESIDMTIRT